MNGCFKLNNIYSSMLERVVFQCFNKIIDLCTWEVLGGAQKYLSQSLKNKMFCYRNTITKKYKNKKEQLKEESTRLKLSG